MNMSVNIAGPVSRYSIPSDEHIRKLLQLAALRFLSLRARLLQDEVNQIGIALKSGRMTPDVTLPKFRGDPINSLWMIPITEKERQFAETNGSSELVNRLERAGVNWVATMRRKSVC